MATYRHGRNAQVWIDVSSAGTNAAGTNGGSCVLITGRNSWSLDQSVDFVDVTSFGDTTKNSVAGLPGASGDVSGHWDTVGVGTLLYNLIGASTERAIVIVPDATNNSSTFLTGKAFYSVKWGGSTTDAVNFDIHFEAGPTGLTWTHP